LYTGRLLFAQLMEDMPPMLLERCVGRYGGHHKVKRFSCRDQFLCMAFAQLTFRKSQRDIGACLRSRTEKLYPIGTRRQVARNALANADATCDGRIDADFAQHLIGIARKLDADEPFDVDLTNTAYALDSTTIDLSLSLFAWAPLRTTKGAVQMHTPLDLRDSLPSFIHRSDGKLERREHLRSADPGCRSLLRDGSALPRLCAARSAPSGRQFLRRAGAEEQGG